MGGELFPQPPVLLLDVVEVLARKTGQEAPSLRLLRPDLPHAVCQTIAQMLAHHTSNGCNLRPGDVFASGTLSGSTPESLACLLERTRRGAESFRLPTGEERTYLEDGDEVILHGYCEREGCARIGFGECRGIVTAAT